MQMNSETRFTEVMERLQAGDEEAAAAVFRRFVPRLVALARLQLNNRLRHKVDAEDIVQSVYRSFFRRQRGGQFRLDSWDSLWSILAVITMRKCGNRAAHYHAARRDVRREIPLDHSWHNFPEIGQMAAREPTPLEAAMLKETIEQLLHGLDPEDQEIVTLQLHGYAIPEISKIVRYSERTVHRTLQRTRKKLDRMLTKAAIRFRSSDST